MFNKHSQTAIEFMILTGFILFSFTVFFVLMQSNMSDKLDEKRNIVIKEVALIVQNEVDLATQSREGYYREFVIPNDINGLDYEINIVESMVYVRTNNGKHAIALPVKKITGDVNKGINTIKKENDEIKINL